MLYWIECSADCSQPVAKSCSMYYVKVNLNFVFKNSNSNSHIRVSFQLPSTAFQVSFLHICLQKEQAHENPLVKSRTAAVQLHVVAKVSTSCSNQILSNSNLILENLAESKGSYHNVSRPSHGKITIPPFDVLQSRQVQQALAPAPSRVQPSRTNRGTRMADIMASIEGDDDSRIIVPRRKKRPMVESDPEDVFDVPEEIKSNPMAPATKRHKRREDEPPRGIPPLLPLRPTPPTQVPPNFQPKPKPKPRPVSKFRFHPRQPEEFQDSQPQSLPAATFNLFNPSGIPDEDIPMQGHLASEKEGGFSQRDGNYKDRTPYGWFLLS